MAFADYVARGDLGGLLRACTDVLGRQETELPRQREAISHLGQLQKNREAYYPLLHALENENLKPFALLALAQLKDSRALFPVVNVFHSTSSSQPTIHQRVFQYIHATHDPRAVDFLEDCMKKSPEIVSMAATALPSCRKNVDFSYQFCGSEERLAEAERRERQIMVTNENLDRYRSVLEQEASGATPKPQTYVIPASSKVMLIGGTIHEHVDVARGEQILAAGEIEFQGNGDGWLVNYINNRSNGYYPGATSFHWVQRFFKENSNVHLGLEAFSEIFPRGGFNDSDFLALFPYGKQG